jgi:hypothetical protein
MNGTASKIEIMAPFQAAFEWMKAMLFRPFDIGRWLTIAFAAFIAGNLGSSAGNFSRIGRLGNGDWKYRSSSYGNFSNWDATPWIVAIALGVFLIAMVVSVVWMWISSRGKFIFTDCIVKNRAAIGEPWREYRREGNSYFLFCLLVAFCAFVIVAIAALLVWICFFRMEADEAGPGTVIGVIALIVVGLIWIVFALFFGVVSTFMIPVMYRRRCSAREAFADVSTLIGRNAGPFILFVLFGIALLLGVGVIGTVIACVTCCVGGLPYISTVLLLPAIVWLATFKLLFLRQFGDQYDVWANAAIPAPSTLPPPPPPTPA